MSDLIVLLSSYLKEVSVRLKSDLRLDGNALCMFKKEHCSLEFVIELDKQSGFCFFYTPITKVPFDFPEKLFERLLVSNLFGVENNQAIFGLDVKTQHIVLSYGFQLSTIDGVAFGNMLINFTRTAENARKRIDKWLADFADEFGKTTAPLGEHNLNIKA